MHPSAIIGTIILVVTVIVGAVGLGTFLT